MKSIEAWFEEYGQNHRNEKNKYIHFICVPLIYLSIMGILSALPSYSLYKLLPAGWTGYAHFGTLLLPFVLLFYLRLSVPITLGMLLFSLGGLALIAWINSWSTVPAWQIAFITFVVAWLAQFYGHHLEGKRPSFLKDLSYLLIGPAWILAYLYRKWGITY